MGHMSSKNCLLLVILEQELFTIRYSRFFQLDRVVRSLDFCVLFCRSLFVLFSFFFWVYFLFFDLRLLITAFFKRFIRPDTYKCIMLYARQSLCISTSRPLFLRGNWINVTFLCFSSFHRTVCINNHCIK